MAGVADTGYNREMTRRISSKGQIVLPAEIRRQDDIRPGQQFEVHRIARGEYRLVRTEPLANASLIDLLLACPVEGFFVPIKSAGEGGLSALANEGRA